MTSTHPLVGVHLDLKGVAFRPSYFPQLMSDLAAQGVNCVMVEYEDVFPFQGIDIAYDAGTVINRRALAALLRAAKSHGIEVIPCQQCLGHLEYLFRWKRYRKFAEDQKYPSTLCLSNEDGKALVKEMLRQVMAAHPESRYVNLGMDEAHGLKQAAARTGRSVLDLFTSYLHELIEVVEQAGKTPMIYSDMLEDHFEPDLLSAIKDRVVLLPWDYETTARRSKTARLRGFRMSKSWLSEPENTDAPPISPSTAYFEDLDEREAQLIAPYRHDREVDGLYQVEMWTRMGFRVFGLTAIRVSRQGAIYPDYLHMRSNIRCWAEAIQHSSQLGVLGTSWARGTTFCPPNFIFDLTWPNIAEMAESMGVTAPPFFAGIAPETVQRLLYQLARCKSDWSIEAAVADEMEALTSSLTSHHYEWKSLILMARAWGLTRQVDYAILEVDFFRAAGRPVPSEWQRRLRDQLRVSRELRALRKTVKVHFGKRYHGLHFDEWLAHLFDVPIEKMRELNEMSQKFLADASRRYD